LIEYKYSRALASIWQGRVVALLIAVQWAELRCADPMAEQSREGLPAVWRLVDHTAVLPTVAHMLEPRCAGLTAEQPP